VIGSTRPGRKAEAVAHWVYDLAKKRCDAELEIVDIKDFNLPLLDEAMPPSQPHRQAWAAKNSYLRRVRFRNAGIQSRHLRCAEKRARFLYREWNNKAAGFVSYGGAGGTRAVEQLRLVMGEFADCRCARASNTLAVCGFREFHHLQTGSASGVVS